MTHSCATGTRNLSKSNFHSKEFYSQVYTYIIYKHMTHSCAAATSKRIKSHLHRRVYCNKLYSQLKSTKFLKNQLATEYTT